MIPGSLQKYVPTNRSLLQCKTWSKDTSYLRTFLFYYIYLKDC